ncbi:MAG TPA: aspartate aminotransferase family protein [Thermoleophilaceae bacterium]
MGVASHTAVELDRERVRELTERELAALNDRTPRSAEMFWRAERVLPGGVPSSYHLRRPWPVYMSDGEGARVWDVDGNEYVDFHNGFGAMVQGHAHPAIGAAVSARYPQGTHFGAPTEDSIAVAEELARRFRLPRWRFTNSGTESTMGAIRIARGLTGREDVIKAFGSYHGHGEAVMVSIGVDYERIGPDDAPESLPYGAGIPRATLEQVHTGHWGDADGMERRIAELEHQGRKPACVILEPAMTNIGLVLPEDGYLAAVRRMTAAAGVVLIFDEVKTGLAIAAGGAVERFGVEPDMVTLAKALGGGLPTGAIGMSEEVARVVEDDTVHQFGTYNGNPLGMAAARASLLEVLTPAAYERFERLSERMRSGIDELIASERLPAYTVGAGARGCVTFAGERVMDYRSFKRTHDPELCELAWLYAMNRGVLTTRGRQPEWTLCVAHDEADVNRYVEALAALAAELTRR